jgi:hypothetical protein
VARLPWWERAANGALVFLWWCGALRVGGPLFRKFPPPKWRTLKTWPATEVDRG